MRKCECENMRGLLSRQAATYIPPPPPLHLVEEAVLPVAGCGAGAALVLQRGPGKLQGRAR